MKLLSRKQKITKIHEILEILFPDPKCELIYETDYELLFAIILSAQTTDRQVNLVTNDLFKKYKKLEDYQKAGLEELKKDLSRIGLFNAKANNILKTANILIEEYNGKPPVNIDLLQLLPGVGRKTANVFLWEFYGICEGMAVDTHVKRLAIKLGLTKSNNVIQIEKDLCKYLDKSDWGSFGHRLILYGRYYWTARQKTHEGPLNPFAIKRFKKT